MLRRQDGQPTPQYKVYELDPPPNLTDLRRLDQQGRLDVNQELFECFRIGHDGFEYRNRRMILGQQAGHSLEFPKIQSENCLHGRESPGSKELKRVYLNILPNSAFGCPTHDLHGFSLHRVRRTGCSWRMSNPVNEWRD